MTRGGRRITRFVGATIVALATFVAFSESGVFDRDIWQRKDPLANPLRVASVRAGTIVLVDGREFRPAGVGRADSVPVDDYDRALRVIVAQGVVVIRDLGDGRAFLLAEPRFYNWCGTRTSWTRWAGSYLQRPVSELLVHTAYARPDLDQPGLSPRERWRLEGVGHFDRTADAPTQVSINLNALRYDGSVSDLDDYDATLELMWKPPPAP